MIEISHQLAQRLIRKGADARLPEEQWAVLHAHLESCERCRTYQQQQERVERDMRRALRAGWDPQPGPAAELAGRVSAGRRARAARRQHVRLALATLVCAAFFWLLGGPGWLAALLEPPAAIPVAGLPSDATATPSPTARPGEFPGVVVFAARAEPGANSEIYLLNPGDPLINMSRHPAEDSDPAWSPDGEWIAFLSDRAGSAGFPGSSELFVTNLTGSRLVQLTHDPGITWQGPLSWSRDGQFIALTGIREAQGRQRWVYLVPLDGSGPVALAGSRGGWAPRFSRYGNRLAFAFSDGETGGIAIHQTHAKTRILARWTENGRSAGPLAEASFDWSQDSSALAFVAGESVQIGVGASAIIAAGGTGSQVVALRQMNFARVSLSTDVQRMYSVAESVWPSAFRAVSWTPGGAVVYLESLRDARARPSGEPAAECWRIHTRMPGFRQDEGRVEQVGGLCVESGFDSGSWTQDGSWLVALGRPAGESRPGLYAVRVDSLPFRTQPQHSLENTAGPGTVLRLTDAPFDFLQAGGLPRVRPRLRVYDPPVHIDPQPAAALSYALPPSDLSVGRDGPPGKIAYVVESGQMGMLVTANPDGTGGQVVFGSQGMVRCPRWSPDGRQIALLSRPPALAGASGGGSEMPADPFVLPGVEEIYRMDAGGGTLQRISRTGGGKIPGDGSGLPQGGIDPTSIRYSCPVWSPEDAPGGPYLVALLTSGYRHWLAVLPLQGTAPLRFVPLGLPATGTGPVWSPDGRSLFLAEYARRSGQPQLVSVRLPEAPDQPLIRAELPWENVAGLLVLPERQSLAMLSLDKARQAEAFASLRQVAIQDGLLRPRSPNGQRVVAALDASEAWRASHLTWLPGDSFGLVLHASPSARSKARLIHYDLLSGQSSLLAEVEDRLEDLAWSPDGRWLIYVSESGLWGLDIEGALAGRAAPTWLSPVPVQDLDWR